MMTSKTVCSVNSKCNINRPAVVENIYSGTIEDNLEERIYCTFHSTIFYLTAIVTLHIEILHKKNMSNIKYDLFHLFTSNFYIIKMLNLGRLMDCI